MKETFLVLLTAHLLGDFLFQNDWMVKARDKAAGCLLLHASVITLSTIVIAAYVERWSAVLLYFWIFAAHYLIDLSKNLLLRIKWIGRLNAKNEAWMFLADQVGHIVTLAVLACLFAGTAAQSLWLKLWPDAYFSGLTFVSGLVACVFAGGILISKVTRPLVDQLTVNDGLKHGGRYIGQLERVLTFFFMLTGQTSAIGFLFAAKSILRFGEIKDAENRKQAEYIIIGTFMSFGWALVIAYLTIKAMALWQSTMKPCTG
jgi:hypothetical protein